MDERPVGFFDSGIGGRCILDAFHALCPKEHTVYIADTEHCPYGNKSQEEIIALSEANVKKLLARKCKMIVVACNTATAAAIDYLRERYPEVPFVGLEPAVKPAAIKSRSGVVAVLATHGTFNGRLYKDTTARFAKNVTVIATVADEFVVEVEKLGLEGLRNLRGAQRDRLLRIVRKRIEPLVLAGADHIVLGCTHFPHLKTLIEEVVEGKAEIVDPSNAVARQARRVLSQMGLLNDGQ